ncbi:MULTISPECIES: primosomal protein N' [unclassified Iodidimonas]|jgi:primosomal protein N' (replication factor Y)|uniref:primosomal protein N' n=1 Tax=unclassified Iodidimonas TaxID=2626145 RepID=UPI002482FF67|nr:MULTISPECIES: primosomal protein N' [unclassified Iodidimonas]
MSYDQPQRLKVLLALPVAQPFDYLAPLSDDGKALLCRPGAIVRVPFGRQSRLGVIWDDDAPGPDAKATPIPDDRLKPIEAVLDLPPMGASMRGFIGWVSRYTMAPLGAVLRMALPAIVIEAKAPIRRLCAPAPDADHQGLRLTRARKAVLGQAKSGPPQSIAALAAAAGVSDAVVRGLIQAGILMITEQSGDSAFAAPDPDLLGADLSADQRRAAQILCDLVAAQAFAPVLLEGVTGSGKTEVYFEAIARALQLDAGNDAQILVLLPEISLTSQWLDRFKARFGVYPVQWHSDLGPAERRRAWHQVASSGARVVVGARSALFLPFRALSLIVVDEEHDPGFKQEEGVLYNARDMAVVRARMESCPVILSSATPALETLLNAREGRYRHCLLPSRFGSAELPDIRALDLRLDPPESGQWLAQGLVDAVDETLARGEQALLFLNRRGYAPLTLCRSCGERLSCPHCSTWLVEHRYKRQVQCHHCGYFQPSQPDCPACGAEDAMVACGPGVERVAEEAARRWPDARLDVMTSDTITSPAKARMLIGRIEAGETDIIIGTQIITKGYHFPMLTLVGVVDADLGLRGGDLRAGERCWQQLMQVAGRAGRADRPGIVYLQSYDPSHPVTKALISGNRDGFLDQDIADRRAAGMPPFGRLAALILSGPDLDALNMAAKAVARAAPMAPGIAVFGPAPAPLARLRGQHRQRLLLQTRRDQPIQAILKQWLAAVRLPSSVRLRVDVDPYSFL